MEKTNVMRILDQKKINHNVLKNAKLFVQEGKNPSNGVYGYSAWNNKKGFVSFVNPTSTKQTYELTLDNIVGVPTSMKGLKEYSLMGIEFDFSYISYCIHCHDNKSYVDVFDLKHLLHQYRLNLVPKLYLPIVITMDLSSHNMSH